MTHYAFINTDGIVVEVIPGRIANSEGINWEGFYAAQRGLDCRMTSASGEIRKNYAGIGFTYDHMRDAFIPPKPSDDAVLDEETCTWTFPQN